MTVVGFLLAACVSAFKGTKKGDLLDGRQQLKGAAREVHEIKVAEEEGNGRDLRWREEIVPEDSLFQDIYFEYNRSEIDTTVLSRLVRMARRMNTDKGVTLRIEGHCDERGSQEYNLALGERRAAAAALYLGRLGVESVRLEIISFGEERPLDRSENEAAYAKNRRVHFEVKP